MLKTVLLICRRKNFTIIRLLFIITDNLLIFSNDSCRVRGLYYRYELIEKTLAEILLDEDDRHAFLMWRVYNFTDECCEEEFLFMDGDGGNRKDTLTKVWIYMANFYVKKKWRYNAKKLRC